MLELVRESRYPQVVFESLLDHIERLLTERHHRLYGDDTDRVLEDVSEDGRMKLMLLILSLFIYVRLFV